ncbi:AAA domain-containing protein 1 [Elsinoe australis]|uniref:AAA domain-containing protein 1 n=1 Tax=Elsinoe australis TaxID=40998 RepID=A0A4U7BBN3_9PEZI|nr:AAA domain-containing protein 1 [Elsinoe australis]
MSSLNGFAVFFSIDPNPLQPRFVVELRLRGPPKNDEQEHAKYRADRVSATFAAAEETTQQVQSLATNSRKVHRYQYSGKDTPLPSGALNFSHQLYHVSYNRRSDIRDERLPSWEAEDTSMQHVFTWRANAATMFSFSRSFSGMDLEPAALTALQTFKKIIQSALAGRTPLQVVTRKDPRLSASSWPWFAALPAPVPQTYWPWLKPTAGTEPDDLMGSTNRATMELSPYWIEHALAKRDPRKTSEWNPQSLPAGFKLGTLPSVVQFQDSREYIAHILGSHTYEDFDSKAKVYRYYNGAHTCDVIPDPQRSNVHLVLLHISAPAVALSDAQAAAQEAAKETALPEIGERVRIDLPYHSDRPNEEWQGKVVRIPDQYLKQGWNVAVRAVRPPSSGGIVPNTVRIKAELYFGHSGTSSARLRNTIIDEMLNKASSFIPRLLLCQDNHQLPGNYYVGGNPLQYEKQVIERVFKPNNLNKEQQEAILHFLSHKITLLVGPPGTGKSTVIKHILNLAQKWDKTVWACTDSNAAIDVIANKHVESNNDTQPPGYFRVRPMFDENLPETYESTVLDGQTNSTSLPGFNTDAQHASRLAALWQDPSESTRVMSLGRFIALRLEALRDDRLGKIKYAQERQDLEKLAAARSAALAGPADITLGDAKRMEEDLKLRKEYLRALRQVQRGLVAAARGIFSTVSAASGMLVPAFKPNWVIMDEASQFAEAKAAFALLHAFKQGNLQRIILVGDDKQLPPTLMASINPFAATGSASLFERLMMGGTPSIQLRTQYRAHPSISAFYNANIYNGTLRDAPLTSQRNGAVQFQKFVKGLATAAGMSRFPTTNSVMVSIERDEQFTFGSEKLVGSTSRVNFQTAATVCALALRLLRETGLPAKELLVTAFYSDQVRLLKALFEGHKEFEGIRIDTVDGSQGSEAAVQIIDCVVLGSLAGDTFGFLSSERRRVNVAMSRAMCGQIVIGHRDMSAGANIDQKSLWPRFVNGKKSEGAILSSKPILDWILQNATAFPARLSDIRTAFKTAAPGVRGKDISQAITRAPAGNSQYDIMAFLEQTIGASDLQARQYLADAGGSVIVAVEQYEARAQVNECRNH